MANITLGPLRIKGNTGGKVVSLPEAASQTFKKGQLIYITTSGLATLKTNTDRKIFGIALEDGHNGTASEYNCLVQKIMAETELIGNIYKTGDLTNSLATAATIGDQVESINVSGNDHFEIAQTTNAVFTVTDVIADDASTDVYRRICCTPIPAYLQTGTLAAA